MNSSVNLEPTTICHVVAMPYPGRGHINPMMNLCKSLASKTDNILITFVVTEEWLGFIGTEPKPDSIRFATIPNVIPSELVRAADVMGFVEATMTKLEAPFERLLDQLEPLASVIIADTILFWAIRLGNQRNIPVASFWPMSAAVLSVIQHFDLCCQRGHSPVVDLLEKGHERVDYIPGLSPTRIVDLPLLRKGGKTYAKGRTLEAFEWLPKAQYLLLTSVYELESQAIDALKEEFALPIYTIGPSIPHFNLEKSSSIIHNEVDYLKWLDRQPNNSVLFVSLGSFLSVSSAQMNEIAAGLRDSGFRFLWVARGESCMLEEECDGDNGLVVPWCDQLKVLCHSSINGFWTHCGWNSIKEGIFAGVPFLTFPIAVDQYLNSKFIVEDWKIGWRVKEELRVESLVTRHKIAGLVKKFMDLESSEGKEMRRRAEGFQEICHHAIATDGLSDTDLNSFIKDIFHKATANWNINA